MLDNLFGSHQPDTAPHAEDDHDTLHVVQRAAIFAVLLTTFAEIHPFCDHIVQTSRDAMNKGMRGGHQVYWIDGVAVGQEPKDEDRASWRTMTASELGRRCAAHHVLTYTLGQAAASAGVRRVLGLRVPWRELLAGTAINALTHYVIDRREPLNWFLRSRFVGKRTYLEDSTVQRKPGAVDDSGPGTGLYECDQAVHRLIGVAAALMTTRMAVRSRRLP